MQWIKRQDIAMTQIPINIDSTQRFISTIEDLKNSNLSNREIFSRYLISNGDNNLNSYDPGSVKNLKNLTDLNFRLKREIDYVMALFAERQDMFGMLFKYPRTVFVLSDMMAPAEGLTYGLAKPTRLEKIANFLTLYPKDIDQVIIVTYLRFSAGTSVMGYSNHHYIDVSVLKLGYTDSKTIPIYRENIMLGLTGELPKDQDVFKIYTDDIIKKILPETIFGTGYTFELQKKVSSPAHGALVAHPKGTESEKPGKYRMWLRNIVKFIDHHSRNSFATYTTLGMNERMSEETDELLLKSLNLGFITYIYPDKMKEQMNEPAKIGEVTADRLKIVNGVIDDPKKIMNISSNFQAFEKITLKNCHSDEEW